MLLSSFKPAGSSVVSVKVYPSDFGLERMAKEDIEGPVGLADHTHDSRDDDDDDDDDNGGGSRDRGVDQSGEGDDYSKEKLRRYQLSRFK